MNGLLLATLTKLTYNAVNRTFWVLRKWSLILDYDVFQRQHRLTVYLVYHMDRIKISTPPFRGVRDNARPLLMARWKARHNWTFFASSYS